MKWILRAGAGTALLGVAVFGGLACTDDEGNELTLDEYFQQLEEIDNEFSEKSDAVFEGVSEDPDISEVQEPLEEFAAIINDFVANIEGLEPPEEAQEAHDAAVDAGNATSDAYDELVDAAGDADSVEELFTSDAATAAEDAIGQFGEVCLDLQQLADDNSIDVALDCGEDEEG